MTTELTTVFEVAAEIDERAGAPASHHLIQRGDTTP
jgi:hypothetical protein